MVVMDIKAFIPSKEYDLSKSFYSENGFDSEYHCVTHCISDLKVSTEEVVERLCSNRCGVALQQLAPRACPGKL